MRYFKIIFDSAQIINNIYQPITSFAIIYAKNPIDAVINFKAEMIDKQYVLMDIVDMGSYI